MARPKHLPESAVVAVRLPLTYIAYLEELRITMGGTSQSDAARYAVEAGLASLGYGEASNASTRTAK